MGTGGGGAGVSCGSSRTGQKMVAQQWWVRGWDQGWWDLEHVHVSWTEPTNHEQQSAGGEEKSRRKDV